MHFQIYCHVLLDVRKSCFATEEYYLFIEFFRHFLDVSAFRSSSKGRFLETPFFLTLIAEEEEENEVTGGGKELPINDLLRMAKVSKC